MAKEVFEKSSSFYGSYERRPGADKVTTHYCPGCGHGNVHKLIAETIEDMGIQDRTIFVSPVGCSVFAYYYFATGNVQVAHGRAPAAATGIKRAHPDSIVIVYQGDGDLAAIGTAEILHAANRGEGITVFFINNAIYGMTGGQMAPTTLVGQKTTTTPRGRTVENEGHPLRIAELLSGLEAPVYIERTAASDAKHMNKTRKAIRKAIQAQIDGKGFSFVEILSPCPTGWGISPVKSRGWIHEALEPIFPLGVTKDRIQELPAHPRGKRIEPANDELWDILEIPSGNGQGEQASTKMDHVAAKYRDPLIKVAGFGGQGVLMLGVALADCGMRYGYNVSWLPSYGPEMRGGTANCHVRMASEPIGSPIVAEISVLVAMNRPSLEKFEKDLIPGGLLFYDSTLVDVEPTRTDVQVIPIPATKLADELGQTRAANMVIMGAYITITKIFPLEHAINTLPDFIKKSSMIPLNVEALKRGEKFILEEYKK
ncbi:MAG: 2-oxoacid:acceptor oxidoreductase family protein [Candidatus Eisenbacteria bacterium]|uniref:2-oxoacid:acceptor oxidoreductase family protein n=1 Tax=Eiseniibacteriota bacterium TaxID=2212470 RepID=A0A948RTH7_UNCEI|nr:2-oxoacid:acceptor oxidoreductase family protein [Candidatus Eisenbacteria bacterium]MBU1947242.1 2-oxoacid:acceptor oxidoreductase family protein [Candidatus Eisenbacteria bacterium]MBU2690725.1 2-oxoacid:acceptor oxidoreductase family protein [Candidatus Eisenbacteria bacterium]